MNRAIIIVLYIGILYNSFIEFCCDDTKKERNAGIREIMRTFTVESIDQFNILAARLREKGYKPWQYQDFDGFHAWFGKAGKDDIEVVTHSDEVRKAIMRIRAT